MAIDQEAWEAAETVHLCCDGCELFRIVKLRSGEKKDVLRVSCLKDEIRAVKVENVENEWSDSINASKFELRLKS